eukprot:gene26342-17439_t
MSGSEASAVEGQLAALNVAENAVAIVSAEEARSPLKTDSPGEVASPSGKSKHSKVQDVVPVSTSTSDFVSVLGSKILELEKASGGSAVEREASKARKKQLREVTKFVSDKSNSPEERVSFLMTKYTQLVGDFIKMERNYHEVQNTLDVMKRERDKVQTELKKANALKDKLEELCRVLQRENREVLEEARRRSEEDVKQRQALQLKFSQAIELQKKDLEVQLANAKFEQQQQINEQLGMKAELLMQQNETLLKVTQKQQRINGHGMKAELLMQQNETLLEVTQENSAELGGFVALKDQNVALIETNIELKQQLEHYYSKFEDFQGTLTKSNTMFGNLKKELDAHRKMFGNLKKELDAHHKVRAKLIGERDDWTKRCKTNEAAVQKLNSEKLTLRNQNDKLKAKLGGEDVSLGDDEELRKVQLQRDRLEGLCRALQAQVKEAKAAGSAAEVAKASSLSETKPETKPSEDTPAADSAAAQAAEEGGGAKGGAALGDESCPKTPEQETCSPALVVQEGGGGGGTTEGAAASSAGAEDAILLPADLD